MRLDSGSAATAVHMLKRFDWPEGMPRLTAMIEILWRAARSWVEQSIPPLFSSCWRCTFFQASLRSRAKAIAV